MFSILRGFNAVFSILRVFHTPYFHTPCFPYSVFSMLRVFNTPCFPHCVFSILHVFHTACFPYSVFPILYAVFSTFRDSVLRDSNSGVWVYPSIKFSCQNCAFDPGPTQYICMSAGRLGRFYMETKDYRNRFNLLLGHWGQLYGNQALCGKQKTLIC